MASPPSKRRRTSSTSLHDSPPHRRTSISHSTTINDGERRRSRAEHLAGFDDTDDLAENGEREEARPGTGGEHPGADDDEDEDQLCSICLSPIENKTVVYPCHHGQFCWNCIRAWTDQSRKCPLCLGPIEHLIHSIRSPKDYSTHYLHPLHVVTGSSSASDLLPPRGSRRPIVNSTLPRHALYGRSRFSSSARLNGEVDDSTWREKDEERALERRRYVYREGLYAKHVASNRYTGFKPFTPQTFANNPELKAKVIKFVRRELQVFPAVDISFLTTYLISIASQLDLRSAAAIRLISDFLSEQDAQHLVHEITTFARSPFTSLEGYDRFIQYGRPERERPQEKENERIVIDEEDLVRDAPRFAANMRRKSDGRGAVGAAAIPPPPPSMARLPPRPSDEVRRISSQDELFRQRQPDRGYGPRPPPRKRSPSPLPSPPSRGGGRRERGREPEPDWRDRDERYSGSYYAASGSRRDVRRPSGRGRERSREREGGGGRRYSYRSPSRSRSGSRERERYRSPPSRSARSRSRSISPRPRTPSPSYTTSRRSRSRTLSLRTPTPPPPPEAHLPELDDAVTLAAPSLSDVSSTPRPTTPAQEAPKARPVAALSIFGAARRLLGKGNVVTISTEGGRESLQVAGRAAVNGAGKGKANEVVQEPYDAVPASLLARIGGVSSVPPSVTPEPPATASSNPEHAGSSLRAKLQARLTAEYRQALASKTTNPILPPSSSSAAAPRVQSSNLRSILRARLQAEKALAYEQLHATRRAGSSVLAEPAPLDGEGAGEGRSRSRGRGGGGGEGTSTTTFSQATRDLLMARLEEERLLALAATAAAASTSTSTWSSYPTEAYPAVEGSREQAPTDEEEKEKEKEKEKEEEKSESALKAALLAKRKAKVEDELRRTSGELKERLMRDKLRKMRSRGPGPGAGAGVGGGKVGEDVV
ncbi:hypothetical protein JCM1840_001111 [Sporobolomyces johnsonii]